MTAGVRAQRAAATQQLAGNAAPKAQVRVILDTDIGPDADDAGALALLHALADKGEAKILGVMCSTKSRWAAPCADAINTYYGRPNVPVGTLKREGFAGTSDEWEGETFNRHIATHFPNRVGRGGAAPDAVALYRKLLAEAPENSVVIAVTGPLTNLRDLLASRPDATSPLDGRALVAKKVRLLSVMGGKYPEGREANFFVDPAAAKRVVEDWPTQVVFSGFEIGEGILTGPRLQSEVPASNPVKTAYRRWDAHFAQRFAPTFDRSKAIMPHSSFDQTAVLYAVRGAQRYWSTGPAGQNRVGEDGSNQWVADSKGKHRYLMNRAPAEWVASTIEDLMVQPPARKQRG